MVWFARLSTRERALLGFMGLLGAGVAFYTLVWQPLETARQTALRDIERYDRIEAEVRAAGTDLRTGEEPAERNPATAVTGMAAEFDLSIRRLEPEGDRTRVVMAEAGYDTLIEWLAALEEEHALSVTAIELDRRPEPGVVAARITLEN